MGNKTNSEIRELVDEYIHSERNRIILKRRWIDGIAYEQIADEFCLSVQQVKSIVYSSRDEIIKRAGI